MPDPCTIVLNSSWILSNTSLFTSSVLMIFLFESCSASCARFDAITPHSAYVLPRCGVPRKIIALVRDRYMSDLRSAWSPLPRQYKESSAAMVETYIFNDNAAEAVCHKYDRVLIFSACDRTLGHSI
jgi:hypothetical protein